MTEKILADPYVPRLDTILFGEEEQAVIAAALATQKPWNWKPGGGEEVTLTLVKGRIRDLHKERHGDRCCYCRFPLHGGGHFIVDPEHVLPKSRDSYRPLSFELWNLAIACKRCNMRYKGQKIDFVVDSANAGSFQDSANYRLIHPNFDLYKDHILFRIEMNDDATLVKYTKRPGSDKGDYTYSYFNLQEREVDSFDAGQGRDVQAQVGTGALEAQELAHQFGQ